MSAQTEEKQVFRDVVCTFCGSLCDNIEVTVENNRIKSVKNACAIALARYQNAMEHRNIPRINGEEVELSRAMDRAVEILKNSRNPLIYGMSSSSTEAQRAAVKLAETLGANIDSTSSVCHGPGTISKQITGIISGTLGEVKNRSDVLVFWGSNPMEAHPNHSKRYSFLSKGLFMEDRKKREVIVFDVRRTITAKMADRFFQVEPGSDFEILMYLRRALKGDTRELDKKGMIGGIEKEDLRQVAARLKEARYGTLFYGMGLTMTRGKYMNTWVAMNLIRELNLYTRFIMIPMRGHGNVAGSDSVMAWQTGYPYAVNFSRSYPRYNPGEYTAVDLLGRREVDAALIFAADPAANFPFAAADYLANIPSIVIDPHRNMTSEIAEVVIPSGITGISAPGTVYRMDNVPLRVRPMLKDGWPTDEEILREIEERVGQ